jgi:hypothetical protein
MDSFYIILLGCRASYVSQQLVSLQETPERILHSSLQSTSSLTSSFPFSPAMLSVRSSSIVLDLAAEGLPSNTAQITAAPFFGILMNWGLMGMITIQLYTYYLNFHATDRLLL